MAAEPGTAKFGNCGVRSPVLSGSGRFVARDEKRQITQKSRQPCRVSNVGDSIKRHFFPTLATPLHLGSERLESDIASSTPNQGPRGTVGLPKNEELEIMLGWSYILIIGSTSGNSKTWTKRTKEGD